MIVNFLGFKLCRVSEVKRRKTFSGCLCWMEIYIMFSGNQTGSSTGICGKKNQINNHPQTPSHQRKKKKRNRPLAPLMHEQGGQHCGFLSVWAHVSLDDTESLSPLCPVRQWLQRPLWTTHTHQHYSIYKHTLSTHKCINTINRNCTCMNADKHTHIFILTKKHACTVRKKHACTLSRVIYLT